MNVRFTLRIDIPALDRLLDFLERHETAQAAIDASTQRIKRLTAALRAAVSTEGEQK